MADVDNNTSSSSSSSVLAASAAANHTAIDTVRYVSAVWIAMPVALVGIIGNMLSVAVLARRQRRLSQTQASSATLGIYHPPSLVYCRFSIYCYVLSQFQCVLTPVAE